MNNVLVLMSSYNGEKYLREQIDSILCQKGCKIDLFVRDDGSKDNTQRILQEYSSKGLLKWYTGKNVGVAKSFFTMLCEAPNSYEYYAFSDQDDVWKKDKIISAIDKVKLLKEPALYASNSTLVDSQGISLGKNSRNKSIEPTLQLCILEGGMQGATMVFNNTLKQYFNRESIPQYIPMHDYYVAAVCLAIGGNVIYDHKSYMYYRQHSNNALGVSVGIRSKIAHNIQSLLKKQYLIDLEKISKEILSLYKDVMPTENIKFLELTSSYRKSIKKRIKLSKIKGIESEKLHRKLIIRTSILLGNL